MPSLRALETPDQPEEREELPEEESEEVRQKRSKYASGPKQKDPYQDQDQSQMFLPILIALACFFPVLFCLCKF